MPVPKSLWMLGTATFPAVTSSSAIPSPKLVATSVQRGELVFIPAWMHAVLGPFLWIHARHTMQKRMAWQTGRRSGRFWRSRGRGRWRRPGACSGWTTPRSVGASARWSRSSGLTLFERVRDRYVLTESAEGLREAAERMEDGALSLERRALGADRTVSGVLRIATTDALSRILVLPALRALHDRHPDIRAHLLTGPARLNITRREADVAVRYVPPDGGELVGTARGQGGDRVLCVPRLPRAAAGPARSPHRSGATTSSAPEEGMRTWSRPLPEARYVLRANNMSGLVQAVALGIGLGALHCWMADPLRDLVLLWPDDPIEHDDVYLVLHQDVRRTGRVRAFAEALDQRAAELAPQLEARTSGATGRRPPGG